MSSRRGHTDAYEGIRKEVETLKNFIQDDIEMLDYLTRREQLFLKWQLKEITELITHGADTEEEEEEGWEEEEEEADG